MSNETYIGHRYVPQVEGEWSNNKAYEELSIVLYEGNSYTSKQKVPVGVDINNTNFWALSGNYNGQMEQLRQDTTAQLAQTAEENSTTYKKSLTGVDSINITLDNTEEPIITFIDDDGYKEVYSRLYPIFNNKGVPFVSAISPNLLSDAQGTYMTHEQVRELSNNGNEIVNHNWNHGAYDELANPSNWEEEIKKAKEYLYKNGYTHDIYVNPKGQGRERADIMSKYAKCAFNGTGQNILTHLETFNIRREGFGAWTRYPNAESQMADVPLSYYTNLVDECLASKSWLVFMIHVWAQNTGQDVILGQLIDYIKSKGIKIVTASDGFRKKANRLEVGGQVLINRKGEAKFGANADSKNSRLNSTPITDYPDGSNTVTILSSAYVRDTFGEAKFNVGGRLITDRTGGEESGYGKQFFEVYQSNEIWVRSWNTTGSWNEWVKMQLSATTLHTIPTNSVTTTTPITNFLVDNVSACVIPTSNSDIANFPEGIRGTLLTYRLSTGDNYSYQEYSVYQTGKVYKRWWSGTAWTNWVKITAV